MRRAVVLSLMLVACSEAAKPTRTYNFLTFAGVSMGAIGTSLLAGTGENHKQLDSVGMMGGPFDAAYILAGFERQQLGGFCPRETLEALAKSNPAALDDPAALSCMKPAMPFLYEHPQTFNNWRYTANGGDFDRSSYIDIFYDLSLALGNPFYANPDSPLFPAKEVTSENFKPSICDHPIVLDKFYNKEFNPEGKYPVITFCDGEEPTYYCEDDAKKKTPFDPCAGKSPTAFCAALSATLKTAGERPSQNPDLFYERRGLHETCWKHNEPVPVLLAVDYNGNGKRDFFEPVILNGHERWQDVGKDGCADDKEDGKGGCTASGATGDPNGDDFSTDTNPLGFEGNFLHDDGEPFEDTGLDGVAATTDFGEGNGKYDDAPGRAHWLASDLRQNYLKWSKAERDHLDIFADGGIRDVFNLGLAADLQTSAIHALDPASFKKYTSFLDLPDLSGEKWPRGYYDPLLVDYSLAGRNTFIRYGSTTITEDQRRSGDGDHVGTGDQIVNRFGTFVKWMSERWTVPLGPSTPAKGLGRRESKTYFSDVLGAPRDYEIALPPGYDENPDKHYPLLFLMHGYGMDASNMAELNILIDQFTSSGDVRELLIVYPSGRCCFTKPDGTKDCRDNDENGADLDDKEGYVRDCRRGNFYVNRQGLKAGDNARYGDALFELAKEVGKTYRVHAPMTVELETP